MTLYQSLEAENRVLKHYSLGLLALQTSGAELQCQELCLRCC